MTVQTLHRPTPAPARPPRQRQRPGSGGTPAYVQGTLALRFELPGGLSAVPEAPALRVVHEEDCPQAPPAQEWAGRFVQAVIEVISCQRPLTQLVRWTSESVYDEIATRKETVAAHLRDRQEPRRSSRHQVASVHVAHPGGDVAEVSARVRLGRRSRAIAARLDLHRGRWMCTAISFG